MSKCEMVPSGWTKSGAVLTNWTRTISISLWASNSLTWAFRSRSGLTKWPRGSNDYGRAQQKIREKVPSLLEWHNVIQIILSLSVRIHHRVVGSETTTITQLPTSAGGCFSVGQDQTLIRSNICKDRKDCKIDRIKRTMTMMCAWGCLSRIR